MLPEQIGQLIQVLLDFVPVGGGLWRRWFICRRWFTCRFSLPVFQKTRAGIRGLPDLLLQGRKIGSLIVHQPGFKLGGLTLQGQGAHSVWVGDVLIRKVAEGINTYESNKNLVLTDGCRADSVPNLEIETGEIEGAGHSSTTGRFDDEQLFYLRSRGIPEDEARRLVVHGFFADIIRRIGVPEVEKRLLVAVEKELEIIVNLPLEVQ